MVAVYGLVLILALGAAASFSAYDYPILHNEEIASPSPQADELNYRLPANIIPFRYVVKLTPYLDEGERNRFQFDGMVDIEFTVAADTREIVLHKNMIDVDESKTKLTPRLIPLEGFVVTNTSETLELHFYTIEFNNLLKAGQTYNLHLEFVGTLADDMKGFYRSSYASGTEQRWLATTQLQATEARRAFPCFDEPALKARFSIVIIHKSTRHAISNMPAQSTIQVGETTTTTFEETPLMSTYLIAFIVSDFEYLKNSEAKLRVFSQPSRVEQALYSLSVSPAILSWLEDYVQIKYTLPKMDEVAVPDFDAGAMENWGLVTYRERLILLEEGVSTSESKQRIATVIAHEYAHQWFGDLVSPHWWKDTWLNEGFATYFESFATAEVETTWRLEHQFVVRDLQSSMGADARETSHPMSNDVCSPASISATFDTINYEKAGSVIRMMKHFVKPENFKRGLNSYLNKRSFSVANPRDLWESMDEQIRDDPVLSTIYVPTIMDPWVSQMGYPVLTVTRNYVFSTATLTQERFLLKKSESSTDTHVYKWPIPLTYTTASAKNFEDSNTLPSDWLTPDDTNKVINRIAMDDWIVFNIHETGYYRVNYDTRNWGLLTTFLKSEDFEQIHLLNRAQLIDDSFNLARAGNVHYSIALALSQYLEREIDYVPWYSAFQALSFIDNKLNNDAKYPVVVSFVEGLITRLYSHVGFDEHSVDDHVMKLNRAAAVTWACKLSMESCIQNSKQKLAQWIASPLINNIKPDLRNAVYCTAIREGSSVEWDFLWDQYLKTTVATESTLLIATLGCSVQPSTLQSYLMRSVQETSGIRRQDARAVFTSVYSNPRGVDIALDFLINTWQTTSTYYGGLNSLGSLFTGIANRLNTKAQIDKLQKFFTDNAEALTNAGATAAINNANNIVEETLEWQNDYGQVIIVWIEQFLASTTTTTSTASTTMATGPTTTGTGSTTTGTGSTTTGTGSTTTGTGTTTTGTGSTTTGTGSTTTGTATTTGEGSASTSALSIALFLCAICVIGIF